MLAKLKQLDRILRGEATRLAELRQGTIDISVRGLSLILLVLALFYGACMGLFALITDYSREYQGPMNGWLQVLYSTVKVPALFFLTLVITFPSLYVFNALVGSRLTVKSVLRLLVAAVGVLLAVLASFGTIVAFFAVSTTSYPFMVILNVVVFAVSGILGLLFLFQTLHRLTVAQEQLPVEPASLPEPVEAPVEPPVVPRQPSALDRLQGHVLSQNVKAVFRIWVVVFALVGAQMGWVLRPFIGKPEEPTTFVRARQSNFFEGVWSNLRRLLSE
jgi:hypothetical protein